MSESVEIQDVQPQPILSIRTTCRTDAIGQALAEILPRVHRYVTERGLKPAGPPFTRYTGWDEQAATCTIDAGAPLAAPAEGAGEIEAGELPGGRVAVAWHVGPYDQLGQTHRALHDEVVRQGLKPAGPCWEIYWTDPGEEPDPSKWRTQVFYPVTGA